MHTLHISRPAAHTRTRAAQMPEPLPPLAPPSILSDLYLFPAIPTTFRLRRVSCGRHVSATPRPASRGSHEGKRCSVCIITPPPPMCGNVREHAAVVYGHDSSAPDSAGPLNGPHLFIQSRGLISRPVPDKRFENRNPIPIICPPIVCINGPPPGNLFRRNATLVWPQHAAAERQSRHANEGRGAVLEVGASGGLSGGRGSCLLLIGSQARARAGRRPSAPRWNRRPQR